jgi:hypothetical protein
LRIAATISSSVSSGWSAIRSSRNSACCSSREVLPPLGFAADHRAVGEDVVVVLV